jgi:hypothetical protein
MYTICPLGFTLQRCLGFWRLVLETCPIVYSNKFFFKFRLKTVVITNQTMILLLKDLRKFV